MKWFTAANAASLKQDDFYNLLRVAVLSAKQRTELEPFLIFDGEETERLQWFRDQGVRILPASVPFYEQLRDYVLEHHDQQYLNIRSGAFLRMQIPNAMQAAGIREDFVLYTDCDIIFNGDIELGNCRPQFFAAVGKKVRGYTRFRFFGDYQFNSGVMVMNIEAMRSEYARLEEFILTNGQGVERPDSAFMKKNLFMSDQVALNLYFRKRINHIHRKYNWSPSYGRNDVAKIIHFNGLKWTQWDDFCNDRLRSDWQANFEKLVSRNRPSYEYYVSMARTYLSGVNTQ